MEPIMTELTVQTKERRVHKRITKHFTARLRFYGDHSTDWSIVVLRNLSSSGALFVYDHQLTPGTLVNLKINFWAQQQPIQCFGRVLRTSKISASFYEVAVYLSQIDNHDRQLIDWAADEFVIKKTVNRLESES
jgi:hypothetical protein